jgi:hypothetical protein
VSSVIFASSLLYLPALGSRLSGKQDSGWALWVQTHSCEATTRCTFWRSSR